MGGVVLKGPLWCGQRLRPLWTCLHDTVQIANPCVLHLQMADKHVMHFE